MLELGQSLNAGEEQTCITCASMSAKLGLDLVAVLCLSLRFAVDTHCRLHTLSREGRTDRPRKFPLLCLCLSLSPFHYPPSVLLCFTTTFFAGGRRGAKTGTLHANSGLRINEDGQRRRQRTYCTRFKGHFGTRLTGLRIRLRFAMEDRSEWRRRETVLCSYRYHDHL